MATHPKSAQEKVHGPSWVDVAVVWLELETLVDGGVTLEQYIGRNVAGTKSFMLRCVLRGKPVTHLAQSYTPGGKDGPVTMPAAQYQLLTKVYHWWEEGSPEERVEWLEEQNIL